MITRCSWPSINHPLYIDYHDNEWGVPEFNDQKLFEMLLLEGTQAGLSWLTVLKKRKGYKKNIKNRIFRLISKGVFCSSWELAIKFI